MASKKAFDISSHLGIILAFGCVLGTLMIEGGSPAELANRPAAVLVLGGSVALAFFCSPMEMVASIPRVFIIAFFGATPNIKKTLDELLGYAQDARREGLLKLEEAIPAAGSEFMRKGLQLVVDGTPPDKLQEMLEIEIDQTKQRHKAMAGIFEALGGFGPTLGIIGTVMGLVNVLGSLGGTDPAKLGESIATAFIATLYGVMIANLLWLPLANKLKAKDRLEAVENELVMEALLSIMHGDNPAIVKEKLTAYLGVGQRQDKKGRADAGVTAASSAPR